MSVYRSRGQPPLTPQSYTRWFKEESLLLLLVNFELCYFGFISLLSRYFQDDKKEEGCFTRDKYKQQSLSDNIPLPPSKGDFGYCYTSAKVSWQLLSRGQVATCPYITTMLIKIEAYTYAEV